MEGKIDGQSVSTIEGNHAMRSLSTGSPVQSLAEKSFVGLDIEEYLDSVSKHVIEEKSRQLQDDLDKQHRFSFAH